MSSTTSRASEKAQTAAFEALIAEKPAAIQRLARAARALVIEVMPGATESLWSKQGTASYGVGPKKMSEHFAYFTFAKSHLSFGFYYGADLTDPAGLLSGSGKAMRSVKIATEEQLESDAFRALLRAASTHLPKLQR